MTITIQYSCSSCGLHDAEVAVTARLQQMDVVVWVQEVMGRAIAENHVSRSPRCQAVMMSDVKIPISGAEWVGGPVVQ